MTYPISILVLSCRCCNQDEQSSSLLNTSWRAPRSEFRERGARASTLPTGRKLGASRESARYTVTESRSFDSERKWVFCCPLFKEERWKSFFSLHDMMRKWAETLGRRPGSSNDVVTRSILVRLFFYIFNFRHSSIVKCMRRSFPTFPTAWNELEIVSLRCCRLPLDVLSSRHLNIGSSLAYIKWFFPPMIFPLFSLLLA